MSHERYERIIDAWARAWNLGEVDALDAILAPDYVRHHSDGDDIARDALKLSIVAFRRSFPDLHSVVEDIFGERDRLAIRWLATGTYAAQTPGARPSKETALVSGITLSRIRAWRIEEEWVTSVVSPAGARTTGPLHDPGLPWPFPIPIT